MLINSSSDTLDYEYSTQQGSNDNSRSKEEYMLYDEYKKHLSSLKGVGSGFVSNVVEFLYSQYGGHFKIGNNKKILFIDVASFIEHKFSKEEQKKDSDVDNDTKRESISLDDENFKSHIEHAYKLYCKRSTQTTSHDSTAKTTDKGNEKPSLIQKKLDSSADKDKFSKIIEALLLIHIEIININSFYRKDIHKYPVPIYLITDALKLRKISTLLKDLYNSYHFYRVRNNFEVLLSSWHTAAFLYNSVKLYEIMLTNRDIEIIDHFMLNLGTEPYSTERLLFFVYHTLKQQFITKNSSGSSRIGIHYFIQHVLDNIYLVQKKSDLSDDDLEEEKLKEKVKSVIQFDSELEYGAVHLLSHKKRNYITLKSLFLYEKEILNLLNKKRCGLSHLDSITEKHIRSVISKERFTTDENTVDNLQKIISNNTSLLCGAAGTGKTSYILLLLKVLNSWYKNGAYFDIFPTLDIKALYELVNTQIKYCNIYKAECSDNAIHKNYIDCWSFYRALTHAKDEFDENITAARTLFLQYRNSKDSSVEFVRAKIVSSVCQSYKLLNNIEALFKRLTKIDVRLVEIANYDFLRSMRLNTAHIRTSYIKPFDRNSAILLLKRFVLDKYKFLKKTRALRSLENIEFFFKELEGFYNLEEVYRVNQPLATLFMTDQNLYLTSLYLKKVVSIIESDDICRVIVTAFTGKAVTNIQEKINTYFNISIDIASTIHKLLYSKYSDPDAVSLPFISMEIMVRKNKSGFIKFSVGNSMLFVPLERGFPSEKTLMSISNRTAFAHYLRDLPTNDPFFIYDNHEVTRKVKGSSFIIVDECSMIDVRLFYCFVKMCSGDFIDYDSDNTKNFEEYIVKQDHTFLLIGDDKQLPPIGCGNFFADLIDTRFSDNFVELKTNFRSDTQLNLTIDRIFNTNIDSLDPKPAKSDSSADNSLEVIICNDFFDQTALMESLKSVVVQDIELYKSNKWQIITPYSSYMFNSSSYRINAAMQFSIYHATYAKLIDYLFRGINGMVTMPKTPEDFKRNLKASTTTSGCEQILQSSVLAIRRFYTRLANREFLSIQSEYRHDALKIAERIQPQDFEQHSCSINPIATGRKLTNIKTPQDMSSPNLFKNFFLEEKIIYTKNNYDFMVFNGFVGKIRGIFTLKDVIVKDIAPLKSNSEFIAVEFDNKMCVFPVREAVSNMQLAYAITVHKVQGSEYENIVFILPEKRSSFISSNLIYTAFTRAIKKLYIVTSNSKKVDVFCRGLNKSKRSTIIPTLSYPE